MVKLRHRHRAIMTDLEQRTVDKGRDLVDHAVTLLELVEREPPLSPRDTLAAYRVSRMRQELVRVHAKPIARAKPRLKAL